MKYLIFAALLLTSCAPAETLPLGPDAIVPGMHVESKTLMDKPFPENHSGEIWRFVFDDGTTCYSKWSSYNGGWSCVRDVPK